MIDAGVLATIGGGAIGPATVAYTGHAETTTDAGPQTFLGIPIGTDTPNRLVVVGISAMSGPTVSSVTIGGVAAVKIIEALGAGYGYASLWMASGVAGTTADIVATFPSTSNVGTVLAVWKVQTLATAAHAVASDGAAPGSITIDVPQNGIGIGFAMNQDDGLADYIWSGLTEDYEADVVGVGAFGHSGASAAFATAQVGLPVTVTYAVAGATRAMLAVSFGPS